MTETRVSCFIIFAVQHPPCRRAIFVYVFLGLPHVEKLLALAHSYVEKLLALAHSSEMCTTTGNIYCGVGFERNNTLKVILKTILCGDKKKSAIVSFKT